MKNFDKSGYQKSGESIRQILEKCSGRLAKEPYSEVLACLDRGEYEIALEGLILSIEQDLRFLEGDSIQKLKELVNNLEIESDPILSSGYILKLDSLSCTDE